MSEKAQENPVENEKNKKLSEQDTISPEKKEISAGFTGKG